MPNPSFLATLALLGALLLVGCGRDQAAPPGPPQDASGAATITFVDGFAAGAAKAVGPDALLFVYAGRKRPPCPGCQALDAAVFSRPPSAVLSTRWVAVRLLGGDDLTAETERLFERAGIMGFPTVLAMTAGGDVVAGDLLGRQPRTIEGLVQAMEAAEATNRAFVAERTALLAQDTQGSLEALAARYLGRKNPAAAADLFARRAERAPSPEGWERVAVLSMRAGDVAREKATLERLLTTWPDHERQMDWRLRRATIDLATRPGPEGPEALVGQVLAALEALRAEREAAGRVEDVAAVRLHMAALCLEHDRADEALANLAWIVEHAPDARPGRSARVLLARQAVRRGELEAAKAHAAAVVERAAGTPEATQARMLLADLAFAADDLAEVLRQYRAVVEEAPDSEEAERAQAAIPSLVSDLGSR